MKTAYMWFSNSVHWLDLRRLIAKVQRAPGSKSLNFSTHPTPDLSLLCVDPTMATMWQLEGVV